jgi:galactosylceramidase
MWAAVRELRRQLDAAGLQATRIIGPDAFGGAAEALANETMSDPAGVGAAIDAIGVHGAPVQDASDPNGSATWRSGKKLYASEDGSTYGDAAGGLQRVFDVHQEHIVSLSQGSNFWNPWSGYYPGLPFALHSLMDAHHPWSGHYAVRTLIWAAAHMNQHTAIGMDFLLSGAGVGNLASGCGTMLSYVSKAGTDFTTVIERDFITSPQFNPAAWKRNNASCVVEQSTFTLGGKLASLKKVAVWLTAMHANATVATLYERQPDMDVVGGVFHLVLPVNSIVTITSLLDIGQHGAHPPPPEPAPFPFPYAEDFEGYPKGGSSIARYFADMSGAYEVVGGVLRQQTPQIPIGWFALTADTAPYTIIGAIDWADVTVTADVLLPRSATGASTSIGWIAARLSQTAEECDGPGVICSNPVRAALGRLSALSVFLCKSILYGAFVSAHRALNGPKRRFLARAVGPLRRAGRRRRAAAAPAAEAERERRRPQLRVQGEGRHPA